MLKGEPYAKGASKFLPLKTLQKIINNKYRLENAYTGVIQDYNPEEVRTEYFIKCNKRGERESKLADKKERIMSENYYGTTLKLNDEFTEFLQEVREDAKTFTKKELYESKATKNSCKRFIKKQNKHNPKGK